MMAVYRSPEQRRANTIQWIGVGVGVLLLLAAIVMRGSIGMAFFCAALALVCLYFLVTGFRRGEMEPLTRGGFGPFDRRQEPIRFWLSTAWNIALLAMTVAGIVYGITNMGTMDG